MANAMYPYLLNPAPSPAPASSDKAGTRQKGRKKGSKTLPKEKMGTLNTTLPRISLLRPYKTHFYCHHHGWVTTHGWPSGHEGHHNAPCMFMVSRPSEFTPVMLVAMPSLTTLALQMFSVSMCDPFPYVPLVPSPLVCSSPCSPP